MQQGVYYYVAKPNMRSDQEKMLELVVKTKHEKIRQFCFESLVKDGILRLDAAFVELTFEDLLR